MPCVVEVISNIEVEFGVTVPIPICAFEVLGNNKKHNNNIMIWLCNVDFLSICVVLGFKKFLLNSWGYFPELEIKTFLVSFWLSSVRNSAM
ncbi:hypothetical protein GCM10022250_44750 [Flavobacterium chungbukense]|uniref:Uncharacterized protein n=1 Tax=Flavobacterium chungbukense TaxID=877464 RepID=A0ABP7YZ44_9FLAO